jgi:hypothetical protein
MADVTYTYTGNDFTDALAPYTTTESITGSFTVASPLGDNYPYQQIAPLSFSFSDGVQTITNLNATLPPPFFDFATDLNGNITTWSIFIGNASGDFIETNNLLNDNGLFGIDIGGDVVGIGINESNPGSWTTPPPSPTPEPSTFALLSTGMLGLAGIARRRFA